MSLGDCWRIGGGRVGCGVAGVGGLVGLAAAGTGEEAAVSEADALGAFMHAILNPPEQIGPPWTHSAPSPEPVDEPVEDEDGEMVLVARIPIRPTLTIERRPVFTGCLAYLGEEGR